MARAALEWTLELTAHHSGVSPNTIRRFEKGGITNRSTVTALRAALEAAGVIFIDENGQGPGVRLRKNDTTP